MGRHTFKKDQPLSLGCGYNPKLIIHEFIHAIGFGHEMNRPDRNKYVKIEWKNIIGGKNNTEFRLRNGWETYNTPYDWKSVMHYPAINSESKKDENGKRLNTMTSKVC